MKRTISTAIVAIMCVALIAGCAKSDAMYYDYDVTKYVQLGDYVGVEYEELELDVTDEDVADYINYQLSQKGYGEVKEVTDRAVQTGDTANIDYVGTKDGVAFDGGSAEGYDLVIGSGSFIDGFEDGLIGAKKGQTLDLNLTYPENYGNEELNGAEVVFTVTVNKITETVYPEFTDELANELSEDYPTVEQYKNYAAEQLAIQNEEAIAYNNESTVWSTVINGATLLKDLPEEELEFGKEMAIKIENNNYYSQYGVTFEEALEQSGLTLEDEQIAAQLEATAQSIAKEFIVVVAIARDQDLDITEAEYQQSLETYAKENGYSDTESFLSNIDEKQFYLSLLNEKVSAFLMENAVAVKK